MAIRSRSDIMGGTTSSARHLPRLYGLLGIMERRPRVKEVKIACDICGKGISCNYAEAPLMIIENRDPALLVYYTNGFTVTEHYCSECAKKVRKALDDLKEAAYGD